jgi:hypothetical protein
MEFRVVYSEGEEEMVRVIARTINSGFAKALTIARLPLGNGQERELSGIEFWQVVS